MKRMIIIVLMAIMAIMLTGCEPTVKVDKALVPESSRFIEVELITSRWMIVADKETGVMYAVSNGGYNTGTFTLLVDENGKPLIRRDENE